MIMAGRSTLCAAYSSSVDQKADFCSTPIEILGGTWQATSWNPCSGSASSNQRCWYMAPEGGGRGMTSLRLTTNTPFLPRGILLKRGKPSRATAMQQVPSEDT